MNTTNSLSNTSLLYNRGGYSIKNDSVAISANRFQMLKSALVKLMLVMAMVGGLANITMAQDEVYKTLTFSSSYNSGPISSYTNSWSVTIGSDSWNMTNFNNNNNGWNYVKAGSKNNASVATIITNSSYSEAITKVDVTIDAITVAKINSIKLYTSSNGSTWTEAGTYDKATGIQSVSLSSPTAGLYYRIVFDCAKGSSNGLITVSKVEYYKQATNKYTVTFDPGSGSCETSSLQESSIGSGVPLPVAYPSSNCSSSCTFCGWSTEEITETICTAPNNIVGKSGETYHPTGDITLYAVYKKVIEEDVIKTYNFSEITGFEDWSTSYSEHIINYDVANVIFASASHQTGTITDIPVTKGGNVSLVLRDSYNRIKEVSFVCRQWTTKAQTITLRYSINGGTTYTTTETTSTNFSISESDLNANTNAVQITFSSLDNQVGIESCTIKIAEDAVYSTYPDCTNYDITWYSNGIAEKSVNYENNFSLADGDVPSNPITPSLCGDKVFVGWSETEFEETNVLPTLIPREDIVGSIVTSNKIYYAVFADNGGSSVIYSFAGGTVSSLEATGVTTSGLGDYAAESAPYRVKFDNTGDYMIIPCGSTPASLTFGVKMIGGATSSTFTIQASTDGGSSYSDVQSFATSGTTNTVLSFTTTNTFPSGTNRVKIYFTKGSNVGVGPISINGGGYSAYTTFCPCAYGIDGISDGDLVWAGKNANADWNSTINWTRYNEGGYHLTATAPTSSNNVYIIEKAECEIDALPHINENTTCNNLTMFNGLGIDIAENQTLTINGTATFTNGVINGNVIFGSNATVSGASASSHVDGVVTKSGAANGFTFPTGSNGNLGKVEVTDGTATNVSVQYFSNPAGFGTNDLPRWWNAADMSGENPFNHVSNVEYWKISSNEAITANFVAEASTDMHFNSETAEEGRIPANIQMAFYDNNRWTNVGGSASIDGNTLSINGAEIPASATRGISGNYTTFGSKSKSTVLPIELVSFTANCNGRSALIEWTTATEKNNDFFVLERSNDAVNFKEIARIAGAGNSIEPINYAYTDFGVRNGDNYYRLVQVDYDGTSTASEIIVANCLGTDGEPEVLAYPNPFGDDLTLRFENFGNIQATVEVYDMLGRMVHTQKVNCSQNDYEVVLRLAGLSDGTYNVRISAKEFVLNRQVIKN